MYTALDIGSANTKVIVAERQKDGRLKVLGVLRQPTAGFRKGVIVDPEAAVNSLRRIFSDVRQISKKAVRNVYVNVNGESVRSFSSRGQAAVAKADSEIRQDDIDRALKAAQAINLPSNYLILHSVTREFFVDDIADVIDPLGMNGTRLEVSTLIVSAFAPFVNNAVKLVERSGGAVGGLFFNPLAAAQAVLSKTQKNLGALVVDLGFGTTSAAVYEENKILQAFSFPVGAGHITNDLAVGLKTSVDNAEALKMNYSFALSKEVPRRDSVKWRENETVPATEISRRFLSEIVEVRLAEIFELVNNELKNIRRNGQLPGGVILTGGGAKLAGVGDLAKQELKLSVQVGVPDLSSLEVENAAYRDLLSDPEMAVAVGLLLSAADYEPPKNFEPGSFLANAKKIIRNLLP